MGKFILTRRRAIQRLEKRSDTYSRFKLGHYPETALFAFGWPRQAIRLAASPLLSSDSPD
jgi:hypothetical protein